MGYNKRKKEKHLFEREPEYLLKYMDILREEKHWRNNGQYFMARECQRRALCLEKENIGGYESYQKTENLYCSTRKSNIHTYNSILNDELAEQMRRREMLASNVNRASNNRVNRMNRMNQMNRDVKNRVSRSDSSNWRE